MKIYCSRYDLTTTEDIFDYMMGKDMWVKLVCGDATTYNSDVKHTLYWVRPVSKRVTDRDIYYTLDNIDIGVYSMLSSIDQNAGYSMRRKHIMTDEVVLDNNLNIIRPIEFVSTEEIFE